MIYDIRIFARALTVSPCLIGLCSPTISSDWVVIEEAGHYTTI